MCIVVFVKFLLNHFLSEHLFYACFYIALFKSFGLLGKHLLGPMTLSFVQAQLVCFFSINRLFCITAFNAYSSVHLCL